LGRLHLTGKPIKIKLSVDAMCWGLDSGAKRNRLRKADLNILSKLGNQGLEWRLEPEAFTGDEVGREDDLLDFLVGRPVDISWRGSHRRKRPLAFSMPPFCHEA
jgi:hypothetical protein